MCRLKRSSVVLIGWETYRKTTGKYTRLVAKMTTFVEHVDKCADVGLKGFYGGESIDPSEGVYYSRRACLWE